MNETVQTIIVDVIVFGAAAFALGATIYAVIPRKRRRSCCD